MVLQFSNTPSVLSFSSSFQTMSRDEKKNIKKRAADASRLDNFNDIGDIGEFEELAELSRGIKGAKAGVSEGLGEEGKTKILDMGLLNGWMTDLT